MKQQTTNNRHLKLNVFLTLIVMFWQSNTLYSQFSSDLNAEMLTGPYYGSCIINGITVTCTGMTTQPYCSPSSSANNVCQPSASYSGNGASTYYGAIVFSFSTPIVSVRVPFSCVDNYTYPSGTNIPDSCEVTINGGGLLNITNTCGVIANGNIITGNHPLRPPGVGNWGNAAITITSTVPFTTLTFENIGMSSWLSHPCNLRDIVTCRGGNNAPNFSSNNLSNICPNTNFNLTTLTANNQPANTVLSWHTSTPANGLSILNNPANVVAGTYYAAFYDVLNNCYSPTTQVNANINECISDLSITKTVNSMTPSVGSNVTFTLVAHNFGPNNSGVINVLDVLNSGYTFISATASTGSWLAPNWTIDSLANGTSANLTITATVNSSGNFINQASISSNQNDPNTVNNISSVLPTIIYATPDNFSSSYISTCSGGTTQSVFDNDTINGVSINASQVTTSILNNGGLDGISINNSGIITIPAGSSVGTYYITYQICQTAVGFTSNCAQGIVTIVVDYDPLNAVNDDFSSTPINTLTGGTTPSVFTNDTLDGSPATSLNVISGLATITPTITPFPNINSDGTITIPPGTTIGTYTITYRIGDKNCRGNATTATAIVIVAEIVTPTPQITPGLRANNIVELVDTQSDGKIIIAGAFTAYNNITCLKINRLNTDLTFDTSSGFVVSGPTSSDQLPMDMEVIKTPGSNYNKILLVGGFSSFNGNTNGQGIIRLNANGSVDTSFNAAYTGVNKGASGKNNQIRTLFIFPTGHPLAGKILIGGMFDKYNNNVANKLALLNDDGSFASGSFNTNINTIIDPLPIQATLGFNSTPQSIAVQSDGKIIVGGYFDWYNGLPKNCILRLNVDGSLDATFNAAYTGINPGIWESTPLTHGPFIHKIVIQPDNKIIIGGIFTHYNNSSSNNIARLHAIGSLDTTFAVGSGFDNQNNLLVNNGMNGIVRDMFLDNVSGQLKLYVCGDFRKYKGAAVDEMIRLNCGTGAGSHDITAFKMINGGPNGTSNGPIWCMKKQGDGKIIIGGSFTTYNGLSALNVTRILPAPLSGEARMNGIYYDSEPEIDLFANNNIVLYPNPAKDKIHFMNNNVFEKNFTASIYNSLGQKVQEDNFISTDNQINVSSLSNGTYFVRFSDDLKTITKVVIIKQ